MTERLSSGRTMVAGVAGRPVRHSLSPLIHSAWIAAAGLDAAYVPFPLGDGGFVRFAEGLRGGAVRGINVTIPFKEEALALADEADALSRRAGASNLLIFHEDGRIEARNTDGPGMIQALEQVPGFRVSAAPAVVLGAGGAARAAAAALIAAGVPELRLVNRTWSRAAGLAEAFPDTYAHPWEDMAKAFDGAGVVVNATAAGLRGENDLTDLPLDALPPSAVVMDMVYNPLETGLLRAGRAGGRTVVDGLSMLINQAIPSFEAFYGLSPPPGVDVRALCLAALESQG
jgi:shikimate dehydrogenase